MPAGIMTVAKRKPPGEAPKPVPKTTVKLAADVHRQLRTIASDMGLELSEYLDQVLRPIADRGIRELAQRITKEGK
jgi:hypothetical protein